MMKKTLTQSALGLLCLLTIYGCTKPTTQPQNTNQFSNAVFISCEGAFQKGNAGVTLFNRDTKGVTTDIYTSQNANIPLGDVCQSLTHIGNLIYCIVNNSNKIEIVGANDFKHVNTLYPCNQPRYLTALNDKKAYFSEWGTNDVAVLDVKGNAVTKRLPAGNGPEAIYIVGNFAYVANCGGFSKDSTVTVIDTRIDSVVQTIKTGYNPCAFAIDKNGYLWILCSGYYNTVSDYKNGELRCIDPQSNNLVKKLTLPFNAFLPRMAINSTLNTLYLNSYSSVYSQNVDATSFDNQVMVNRYFYSIGIDPTNNTLYASRPDPSFNKNGYIIRYSINGKIIDSFQCGINAGNFLFK